MDAHSGAGFGVLIALFVGVWVMIDATRRGKDGFGAFIWGFGVFMILCLFLPLWLIFRPPLLGQEELWRDQPLSTDSFYCPSCGQQTSMDRAYCEHCGKATWNKMR